MSPQLDLTSESEAGFARRRQSLLSEIRLRLSSSVGEGSREGAAAPFRGGEAAIPSGVGALDELLGGGWPLGGLSELCGRRSSGRTSVLLASLGSALAAGRAAALVDTGGALDPRGAAAAGVPLGQLLWVRAGARQALKAADLLIAAGGFGLVALDLGEGGAGIPSAAWVRLKHAAERQRTAVIVAATRRTVGAFATAAASLRTRGPRFTGGDGPPLLAGLETLVEVTRRRRTETTAEGTTCAWLVFSSPS